MTVRFKSDRSSRATYQLQDCYFHHTLVEVRWLILYHLHRHDVMRPHILAFDDLSESSLTEYV